MIHDLHTSNHGSLRLFSLPALLVLLGTIFGNANCHADIIYTMTEINGDVVFNASGSVSLVGADLYPFVSGNSPHIQSNIGYLRLTAASNQPTYRMTGPTSFGLGSSTFLPDSSTGDAFGLRGSQGLFYVPHGYTSGDPISIDATFNNHTFASLGITPDTYVWTVNGSGSTITLGVGTAAVPEPSSFAILGLGSLAFLGYRRRKLKQAA